MFPGVDSTVQFQLTPHAAKTTHVVGGEILKEKNFKRGMLVVNISLLLLIGNAASKISLKEIVEEFEVFQVIEKSSRYNCNWKIL